MEKLKPLLPPIAGAQPRPRDLDGKREKSGGGGGPVVSFQAEEGTKQYQSPPGKRNELPAFTEAFLSSPSAAGIPVLEIVRKLEEEKTLRREDREILTEALMDPSRKEKIIKALGDVELGANPRFAVKRLKVLIYGNAGGEVSSRHQREFVPAPPDSGREAFARQHYLSRHPSAHPDSVTESEAVSRAPPALGGAAPAAVDRVYSEDDSSTVTQTAVERVVGAMPLYSGPENFNICVKIVKQLQMYALRCKSTKAGVVKLAVLVGTGSYNPLTRMHMRTFFIAKEYLESRCGFFVLGSLLSPAHGATVRERYRTHASEVLPTPHRVAMAQLMVEDSKFLTVDPWEVTRKRAMDYLSLLQHVAEVFRTTLGSIDIKILYLCKSNMVPKLSPQALRAENFGCVCVCRAPDSDYLRDSLSNKWSGLIWIVEDTAILDTSFDVVTSRKVREKIRAGESVENLVGKKVQDYIKSQRLGAKMNGLEEWEASEKQLPKMAVRRPATRPKPSLS